MIFKEIHVELLWKSGKIPFSLILYTQKINAFSGSVYYSNKIMQTIKYQCYAGAVTLTQSSTNVDKGSSLNIIATFDEASLSWTYKGGTPLSTCSFALNDCFPRQEENMMFTVSSTTNTSTLSIASLNCSINTAVYVASTDSLLTDTVNIDVTSK